MCSNFSMMQTLIHIFIQCGGTDSHTRCCTLYGYMYSLLVQWVILLPGLQADWPVILTRYLTSTRLWGLATQSWTSYPLISSTNTQSVIQTHSRTQKLSLMLMSAPFSARNCTVPSLPSRAAQCRGVCWCGEGTKFEHGPPWMPN